MNHSCPHRQDQLLEAALADTIPADLQQHLRTCAGCTTEFRALQARRASLDALLPLISQGAEPPPDFPARVLAAAQNTAAPRHASRWWASGFTGVAVLASAGIILAVALRPRVAPLGAPEELLAAQKLAAWRAPTDVLLDSPTSDFLRHTPRFGASNLPVPANVRDRDASHEEKQP